MFVALWIDTEERKRVEKAVLVALANVQHFDSSIRYCEACVCVHAWEERWLTVNVIIQWNSLSLSLKFIFLCHSERFFLLSSKNLFDSNHFDTHTRIDWVRLNSTHNETNHHNIFSRVKGKRNGKKTWAMAIERKKNKIFSIKRTRLEKWPECIWKRAGSNTRRVLRAIKPTMNHVSESIEFRLFCLTFDFWLWFFFRNVTMENHWIRAVNWLCHKRLSISVAHTAFQINFNDSRHTNVANDR